MKQLLELFLSFFKVGALTFGGGYAMLPILQREVVENKQWVTEEELMDYFAIGQCTPGLIAVNTATFIGNRLRGIAGSLAATLGFLMPGFLVILAIAALLENYMALPVVRNAFAGVRVCVCVLILHACIKLWKPAIKDAFGGVLFLLVFAAAALFSVSPVILVILAGAAGVLQGVLRARGGKL